jgi:excisionase family DNA binding protein
MELGDLTVRQAARRLGIRIDGVYALLWAGKLVARKQDGRWLVSAADVEKRLRERSRQLRLRPPQSTEHINQDSP